MAGKRRKTPPKNSRISADLPTPEIRPSRFIRDFEQRGFRVRAVTPEGETYRDAERARYLLSLGREPSLRLKYQLAAQRRAAIAADSYENWEDHDVVESWYQDELSDALASFDGDALNDRLTNLQIRFGNEAIVWFVPDDPNGQYKKWVKTQNFIMFANRPFYKEAFDEERKHGKFVVAYEQDDGDIGEIIEELQEGYDDGSRRKRKRKSKRGSAKSARTKARGRKKRNPVRKMRAKKARKAPRRKTGKRKK